MNGEVSLFTGTANRPLAQEICDVLGLPLANAEVSSFSDGEVEVNINENVRGRDVFVVQSTCPPVDRHLMELLILIDALRRASAQRITAVIPYFGYARQDRKAQPRVPITAKLVANLITVAGADRVLTMDLHAGQIQGFFDIPVDNLYAINVMVDHIESLGLSNLVVVSPDVGGIKMARAYSKRLKAELAIVDKRRVNSDTAEVMNILGDVSGRNALMVDDLVATAGSLVEGARAIREAGAQQIYAAISHPILAGPAIERIEASPIDSLVVTNTVPLEEYKQVERVHVLSVAPLLAEAIKRIHKEESISSLFQQAWIGL